MKFCVWVSGFCLGSFALLPVAMATGAEDEEEIIIILEDEDDTAPPILLETPFSQTVLFRGALTNELAVDTQFEGETERIGQSFHRLFLSADVQISKEVSAMISGRTTWWIWAKEDGIERYKFDPELRDTYLHWTSSDVANGTIGLQTWSWGLSDLFPTGDLLNPRDLRTGPSSGLETPKIPVFGLSLDRSIGNLFHLEAVWLPFYQADKTSVIATDFGLMGAGKGGGSPSLLPSGISGVLGGLDPSIIDDVDPLLMSTSRPDEGLENSSAGVRLTGALGSADVGLHYIFDWDQTPVLTIDSCLPTVSSLLSGEIQPEDLDQVALSALVLGTPNTTNYPEGTCPPEYLLETMFAGDLDLTGLYQTENLRRHTVAGDIALPVGDTITRIESSWSPSQTFYTQTFQSIQKPILQSTFGLEYSYDTQFVLVFEFNHRHIFELDDEENLFLMKQDALQSGLVINARFLDYDALEIQLAGIYGITMEDWIVQPSIAYHFNDEYLLQIGARIFDGKEGSPGALFAANDEIYLLSQWNF